MTETTAVEIYILSKVAELAKRMNLPVSDANASLHYDEKTGEPVLSFESLPIDRDKNEKFEKICELLGCEDGILRTASTWDMEQAVESALSRAPRERKR